MGKQGFTRVYMGIQGFAGLHWLALLWDIWMTIWLGDYMVASINYIPSLMLAGDTAEKPLLG